MYVTEVLSWQALENVNDQQMIAAMSTLLEDVKTLPGFLFQNLGKDSKGQWIAVYFWRTAKEAHNSNALMANKDSMAKLMQLIDAETLVIEVMDVLQGSEELFC